MRKAITAILLVVLVALHAAPGAGAERKIYFTGKLVEEQGDGITIVGEKDKGLLAISSARFHYALILPYAENWVFTLGDSDLLRGNAGLVNLTLSAFKTDKTPGQYLEGQKKWLREPGRVKGLEKIEVMQFKNEPVLRNVVDGEVAGGSEGFRDVKMINFFTAKRWGEILYVLHLSRVLPPKDRKTFDETMFLNMITAGFHVDFMRDEEER